MVQPSFVASLGDEVEIASQAKAPLIASQSRSLTPAPRAVAYQVARTCSAISSIVRSASPGDSRNLPHWDIRFVEVGTDPDPGVRFKGRKRSVHQGPRGPRLDRGSQQVRRLEQPACPLRHEAHQPPGRLRRRRRLHQSGRELLCPPAPGAVGQHWRKSAAST